MAEEEKGVQDKPVSEDGPLKENGVAKSPETQANGSVQEDKVNGVGECESPGKESKSEEVQQNGHKPEEQDSMEVTEQDCEGAEGSTFVENCTWVGVDLVSEHMAGVTKGGGLVRRALMVRLCSVT